MVGVELVEVFVEPWRESNDICEEVSSIVSKVEGIGRLMQVNSSRVRFSDSFIAT